MSEPNIVLYGASWCPDCHRSKKFLAEQKVPYEWIDVDGDPEAAARVEEINKGKRIIPTLILPPKDGAEEGEILVNPSDAKLAKALGLSREAKRECYDVIVAGGGPCGLTAALYSAREGQEVLVVERGALGGQAAITDRLDNFPGFPEGVTGAEFADRLKRQAERFGVEILAASEVTGFREGDGSGWLQVCVSEKEYGARALLIATGSTYRRLNVDGEDDLIGAGVHFCATCDGPFYKGGHVAVVGSGNSAAEESLFLTRFAEKVTILVRGDRLKASKAIVDKVESSEKIEVRFGVEVAALEGDGGKLSAVRVRDRESGETERLEVPALFVFIGLKPNADWLPEAVERDEGGFVKTGQNLETSVPGVFAAGDVRRGSVKQAASAAGEGAAASLMIRERLANL